MLIYFLIIRPLIRRHRRYKEMKEAKAQEEYRNAEQAKESEIPDLSELTIVVLNRADPILDNFPYIQSSVLRNEIPVTSVRIYVHKTTHQPVYAIAKVSETATLSELKHGIFTDVTYTDTSTCGNTELHISTQGLFRKR